MSRKTSGQVTENQNDFLMSPKIDFAFKLIFGEEKNKDVLIAFLSAVLKVPKVSFVGLELLNTELQREFKEDKKGILDVRIRLENGEQIDIEIQVLPTQYMPERTLFYWSKMYNSQLKAGKKYHNLKKCVTINILDFKCNNIKKLHTIYHITEDMVGENLTDLLEIHFLELAKLLDSEVPKDESDPVLIWMEFLNAKSRSVIEMLASKNEDVNKAYQVLQVMSQDEKARMAYEAREAALLDELSRISEAEEKGKIAGKIEGKIEAIINMLSDGLTTEKIHQYTGVSIEEIRKIQENLPRN